MWSRKSDDFLFATKLLLYSLVLYTLRIVAEGDRNMYVCSVNNVYNS